MDRLLASERGLSRLTLGLALVAAVVAFADVPPDAGPVEVLVAIALVPFVVRAFTDALAAWAALVWTTVVTAATNIDLWAEGMFFLPCLATLVVAAVDERRRRAAIAAAVAVAAPVVTGALGTDRLDDWNWPFWSMGSLLTATMGMVLFRQQLLTRQLLDARSRLVEQVALEERRRIAREVHDLVGHSLSVVLLHLTGARHLVRRDPAEAERALLDAEQVGRAGLAEIRHSVGLLRDGDGFGTSPTPGLDDLATLVDEYRRAGLDISLDGAVGGDVDELTGLAAYRIVQESLANVARHTRGGSVEVTLHTTRAGLEVTVADHGGTTSASAPGAGHGIAGMTERARALGGSLDAGPTRGGWTVTAALPLPRTTHAP